MSAVSIDDVRAMGPFVLARIAGVGSPDSLGSVGAHWLLHTRDQFVDAVEAGDLDLSDPGDMIMELSGAVESDFSTLGMWRIFTDLAVWQEEDGSELEFAPGTSMTDRAQAYLTDVACRLLSALVEEVGGEDE